MVHYPPVSRLMDEQPRIDGSVHDEQHCYECGASSRDEHMDSIIRYNRDRHEAETRFACREIGECSLRKAALAELEVTL